MTVPPDAADEPALELQRTFGRNFRDRRLAAGLSQADVCRLTGMYAPEVSRVESGLGNLTLKTMHRLAAAIHCRVEVLLVPLDTTPPD